MYSSELNDASLHTQWGGGSWGVTPLPLVVFFKFILELISIILVSDVNIHHN